MQEEKAEKIGVLFVCLGNICRSPLAEWIFRKHVCEAGLSDAFRIKSVGTGDWHVGQSADARMSRTAARYGVSLERHRARQLVRKDLEDYDYVIVMDRRNEADVRALDRSGVYQEKVHFLRAYDPEPGDYEVPDPYYGGAQGFDHVFQIVDRSTRGLLDYLAVGLLRDS
ncbi:MAG TPA: low molecular weight protein-tyrosine-phosphatase [Rhodothermales bacterium]|nr:low molecular weight protein-tyrosine-phosphatase [Rhodothermales bacterium]